MSSAEAEDHAIEGCCGEMEKELGQRHVVPGEQDLVESDEHVHPVSIAVRRLVMVDRVGIPEPRQVSRLEQTDAQILLLALVKQGFAIATDFQEHLPPEGVS